MLTLPIPLSSLFDGIRSTTLRFNRTSICPHCSGTGASTPDHIHVCPFCNGTGIREYCTLVSHEIGYSYSTVCSVCGGSGHQPDRDHVCSRCGGSGVGKRRAFEIDSNRGRFCGHSSEWRNSERFYDFVQRRRSFFAFFRCLLGKRAVFTKARRRSGEAACAAPRFLLCGWLRTAVIPSFHRRICTPTFQFRSKSRFSAFRPLFAFPPTPRLSSPARSPVSTVSPFDGSDVQAWRFRFWAEAFRSAARE